MLFDLHQPHKPRIDSLSSNLKLFKSSSRAVHWAWHPHKHQKSNQVHQCNQKNLCCQKHSPAFGKLCAEHTVFTVWVAGIAGAKMHICPCSGFLHVTCELSTKEVETYGTSCVLTSLDLVFLRMQWCRFLVVGIQKPLASCLLDWHQTNSSSPAVCASPLGKKSKPLPRDSSGRHPVSCPCDLHLRSFHKKSSWSN